MSCANPTCIIQDFNQLEESIIDTYHFDICDGLFAPTFLLNSSIIKALRSLSMKRFDVHLYCHYPSKYLQELKQSGADVICVHVETKGEYYLDTIHQILKSGMKAGLGVLPTSQIPDDIQKALKLVSQVVINTVGPAYSGQPFNNKGLENMRMIKQILINLDREVEIAGDGSISEKYLPELVDAGCNHFICGTSSIFRSDSNIKDNAAQFKKALEKVLNN